jgi:hypothetical protein
MDCVQICPSGNTLTLKFRFWEKPVTTRQIGAGILVLFCVLIYMAGITGHWKSRLTDQELRMWLKMNDISMIQHPSVE